MSDQPRVPTKALGWVPPTFTAATYNVQRGSDAKATGRVFRQLTRDHGVTVLLLQEVWDNALVSELVSAGLSGINRFGQYLVAWDLARWQRLSSGNARLSNRLWFTKGGYPMHTDAAWAVLADRPGRTVTALSYHLPPHVQVPDAPQLRAAAHREAVATLAKIGHRAKTTAVLTGGDDNVDETLPLGGPWHYLGTRATGLRQVQAPDPTHGPRRRIDDFRVRGLRPLQGENLDTPSDHDAHLRRFRFTT